VTLKRQGRQHGFAGLRVSGREFCTHWKLSELGWTRSTQMDSALSTNTTNSSVCLSCSWVCMSWCTALCVGCQRDRVWFAQPESSKGTGEIVNLRVVVSG
jgi:hypothetical protein